MAAVDRDPLHLHPKFRQAVANVLDRCHADGLDFHLYEGFRSLARQQALWDIGRLAGDSRPRVTNARAGDSFHNYGLAADFAFGGPGKWTWEGPTNAWSRLHVHAMTFGLIGVSFEQAHVEMAGLRLVDLKARIWPAGGDRSWLVAMQGVPVLGAALAPKPEC